VYERQHGAVRMGESPHKPAGFVAHIQVGAYLETVECLQDDPQAEKHEESPPSPMKMPRCQL